MSVKVRRGVTAAVAFVVSTLAQVASAAVIAPIDISAGLNESLSGYNAAVAYPVAGSTVVVNGATFVLGGTPGSVPMVAQTWFDPFGANRVGNPQSITFAVPSLTGIGAIYTLINTAHGQSTGVTAGTIDFIFDDGAFIYSQSLVSGVNVRDHWAAAGGTVSNVFGTLNYGGANGVYLDAQEFLLPTAYFGRRLTSIKLTDSNPTSPSWTDPGGQPFLAAVSVTPVAVNAAVPEPATWAMMVLGFGAVGGAMRYRVRARTVTA